MDNRIVILYLLGGKDHGKMCSIRAYMGTDV